MRSYNPFAPLRRRFRLNLDAETSNRNGSYVLPELNLASEPK